MSKFTTPTKRSSTRADDDPSRSRPSGSSPAYSSRRHSLYGIDDRIVIDPGSRVWKVGFSGEPDPRAVCRSTNLDSTTAPSPRSLCAPEIWDLDLGNVHGAHKSRTEARRLVRARIVARLRDVFHKHLMTDGKARKVIVVENTFLPTYVKEELARALFDNLRVPSISFTNSSLLSLAACGRVTGLVLDVGWLETTVTPVSHSRPLYHLARATPLGGRALHARLRALMHHYAYPYGSAPTSSTLPLSLPLLSDAVVEKVVTEACFVGGIVLSDIGPSGDVRGVNDTILDEIDDPALMAALAKRYIAASNNPTTADWTFTTPADRGARSTLVVPGWVRERAAEIFFDDGPDEALSVPQVVIECLLKLPTDLRPELAASILVTGGSASLPGFIPRLRISLLRHLLPPMPTSPLTPPTPLGVDVRAEAAEWRRRTTERYAPLYGLSSRIAILNDPAPLDSVGGEDTGSMRGGAAPRWAPALVPWIGGSLAGVLKTSAPEMLREEFDQLVADSVAQGEAFVAAVTAAAVQAGSESGIGKGLEFDELMPGMAVSVFAEKRKQGWAENAALPDWTKAGVRAKA